MSPDQHCAAALSALRAYLGMGFLKHDHQAFAFRNLVWKFIHTAAHSNIASGVDESAWRIEDLVDAFMHTYETRLWPADSAGEETKAHLNQYIRRQGGGGVCMSYEVEGRLLREGEDGVMWGDGREGSWLWGVLVRFFECVKGEWSPGTRLGVEELVEGSKRRALRAMERLSRHTPSIEARHLPGTTWEELKGLEAHVYVQSANASFDKESISIWPQGRRAFPQPGMLHVQMSCMLPLYNTLARNGPEVIAGLRAWERGEAEDVVQPHTESSKAYTTWRMLLTKDDSSWMCATRSMSTHIVGRQSHDCIERLAVEQQVVHFRDSGKHST
ncbi:hypothetical protein LTR53_009407 [Teratosphaeriaceae sp. CCFEE 6253]|nr:hypothetical protein LTR53_009407 [Teratosphaeriaceae sp. CCFEE 6253]